MTIRARAAVLVPGMVALCLTAATAAAQGAVVTGRVRTADGSALAGATVTGESLRNAERIVDGRTDDHGRFAFIGLLPGPWRFTIEKFGYEPSEGIAFIRRTGRIEIRFALDVDPRQPPTPTTGVLAGVAAGAIQEDLTAAHRMFDRGAFNDAIEAYAALLQRVPRLTSLHLQIGHAHAARGEYERALAAYQAVPAGTAAAGEAATAIEALQQETAAGR